MSEELAKEKITNVLDNLDQNSDEKGPSASDSAGRNFDRGWDAALYEVKSRLFGDQIES